MLAGTDNLPELRISFLEYIQTVTVYEKNVQGNSMDAIIDSYLNFFKTLPEVHSLLQTQPGLSMEDTILGEYNRSMSDVNLNFMVGTTFNDDENSIIVWFNNQAFHTVPLTVNLINNAILK
jgi:hypothetical protein